jgi:hypothetical protein
LVVLGKSTDHGRRKAREWVADQYPEQGLLLPHGPTEYPTFIEANQRLPNGLLNSLTPADLRTMLELVNDDNVRSQFALECRQKRKCLNKMDRERQASQPGGLALSTAEMEARRLAAVEDANA